MKIAVVYNRESQKVINLFGLPNREKYGLAAIERIVNALKRAGHQVIALEGDKDLIDNLENFMPRVMKNERPGMVFNLSYGIQGQARYTHVPGILEMIGIPYVGSGPLAHSLALDKVVAKMIFRQQDLPTPDFAVLNGPNFPLPMLDFPLIVKPKNEAVSFGIRVVHDEAQLREAAQAIFDQFHQAVLVESYIAGREINVGILGNNPPQAFLPVELIFGDGPQIYTFEDKMRKSGREIQVLCPARIDESLSLQAQELAIRAFNALGCFDCARIDMRLDDNNNLYILEINSLPSLGEHGSYVAAAAHIGLDFPKLVNALVDSAAARYFGTPHPPVLEKEAKNPANSVFYYLTERRDRLEQTVQQWVGLTSRTNDPVGIQLAAQKLGQIMNELGLELAAPFSDEQDVWCWQTSGGFMDGILLVGHLDVPVNPALGTEHFRRDPEWLYGEGVGASRAPLAMLEYSLRALKQVRKLKTMPLGVIYYADEGRDCVESHALLQKAMQHAGKVLVLNPGNPADQHTSDKVVTQRRGQRCYRLLAEAEPLKLGQATRKPEVMRVLFEKLEKLSSLHSRKERVAVSAVDLHSEAYPRRLPHRVSVTLQMSYPDSAKADELEQKLRAILRGNSVRWNLTRLSDRPPLLLRQSNLALLATLQAVADQWEIALDHESSLWPSVAGLAPENVPVLCGIGPVAQDLFTSQESVSRISLVQRTLLLTQFLLAQ